MIDMASLSPAEIRLKQSTAFLAHFNHASRANHDCWFEMSMYFDAFLFCFVSMEEMVDSQAKNALQNTPSFRFFKVLRNISTHHSILSGASPKSKFPRPLTRYIPETSGAPETEQVEFRLKPDVLRSIFDQVAVEVKHERANIEVAKDFLASLEVNGGHIHIRHVMQKAIDEASSNVA